MPVPGILCSPNVELHIIDPIFLIWNKRAAMDMADSSLRVFLFGKFCLRVGEDDKTLPPSTHAQALLAYLFLNSKRYHARSVLAALLAPQSSEDAARRTLNQSLWYIRRELPGLLDSRPDQVGLTPGYPLVIDVAEFQQAVQTGPAVDPKSSLQRLKTAVEQYRGDLLEGVYEDWALAERERLRELFLQALERLSAALKTAQDYAGALGAAQRLAQADPLRESAHREIMRLQHLLGHTEAALNQYETCRRILHDELDLDPEPETTVLAQELARRVALANAPFLPASEALAGESLLEKNIPGQLPLVGRSAEKQALLEAFEPEANYGGRVVALEGEPGIGKTRLVRDVRLDLEWHGTLVLEGKAGEFEPGGMQAILPRALHSGLSPMRIEQIRILAHPEDLSDLEWALAYLSSLDAPVQGPQVDSGITPQNQRQSVCCGLAKLLDLWARIAPIVMVLEDFHWAGEDDWDLLVELSQAGNTSQTPAAFLVSLRPSEAGDRPFIQASLERLAAKRLVEQVVLRPLGKEKSSELARLYLGVWQPLESLEKRLYRETGGNPLFLLESLRLWYEQSLLGRAKDGAWQLTPGPETSAPTPPGLSATIETILARRLTQLSPTSRQALQTMAILGASFDFASLRAVLAWEPHLLFEALRQLIQAHFIVETAEAYHFSHDTIRQVAYASLPEMDRMRLHSLIGQALEVLHPQEPEILAYHFHQAGIWARAAAHYQQAGLAAMRRSTFHQADWAFTAAISLAEGAGLAPESLFELYSQRETTLAVLGDPDRQAQDLAAMQVLLDNPGLSTFHRTEWLLRQANYHYYISQYLLSEDYARQALTLTEANQDPNATASALYMIGQALHGASHDDQAAPYFEKVIPLFHSLGDLISESRAWRALTIVYADSSRYDLALEAVQAATTLDRSRDNLRLLTHDLWLSGWIHLEQGNFARAEAVTRESLQISRLICDRYSQVCAESVLVDVLVARGELGPAFDLFEASIASLREMKERKLEVSILADFVSVVLRYLGDLKLAGQINQEAESLSQEAGMQREWIACQMTWGQIAFQRGDLAEARRRAEIVAAWLKENDCPPLEVFLHLLLIDLNLGISQPQAALQNLVRLEILCNRYHVKRIELDLLAQRSVILLALDRKTEAVEAAMHALACLDGGLKSAYAIPFRAYQVLVGCGRQAEALQALDQAAEMLHATQETLSLEQRRVSRDHAPLVGEILIAWERQQPRQVEVVLPGMDGRHEVRVTWTVYLPEDQAIAGKVQRRRSQLQRLLAETLHLGAESTPRALALALGVSERTIAQDLTELKRKLSDG